MTVSEAFLFCHLFLSLFYSLGRFYLKLPAKLFALYDNKTQFCINPIKKGEPKAHLKFHK